jgi:hypothetical protein
MGRKPTQVIWVTFSMMFGSWIGFKAVDLLFWNEELKYKIWEETELNFWKQHGYPKHLQPKIEFESVNKPGSIFRSYLNSEGCVSLDEALDKYEAKF